MEKKKVLKILKIIGFVIGLLVILYFVSQNLFYSVASSLFLIGIPVVGIFLLFFPFRYLKRKIPNKKAYHYVLALVVAVLSVLIYIRLIILLFRWMLGITIQDIVGL